MSTLIMTKCWPIQATPTQKSVLISLADHANDQGICWPNIDTICERTCLSERTVQRAIDALVTTGLLVVNKRAGRSNVYTILSPTTVASAPPCRSRQRDVIPRHSATQPPSPCHRTAVSVTPRTLSEPSRNPKEPLLLTKRAMTLPDNFTPNAKHNALAAELGVNLATELEKFCDHAKATGKRYKDWNAALNNWLRNSVRFWTSRVSDRRLNAPAKPMTYTPEGFK